ncbi:restriction endonuclease [Nitratireductor sp. GCM10026969]|uniref:restriction endonuclease n=1 Tax=Nitratireductor sp. GCM10026969 TaxID=3252645 RepID=UPI0036223820
MAFESVVADLFEAVGFRVARSHIIAVEGRHYEIDLIATGSGGQVLVVEIKAYRSRTPRLEDIDRAARVAANARQELGASDAILVLNLRREALPDPDMAPAGVSILCLDDLLAAAIPYPVILNRLGAVIRELNSGLPDREEAVDIEAARKAARLQTFKQGKATGSRPPPPPPETKGHELAQELLEITPGRSLKPQSLSSGRKPAVPWRLFETVAEESFQYLFGTDLSNWQSQNHVAGKDKRFDALAKVTGDDVFSRSLIEDFRTRYLLFEFKNYGVKLKPDVLHITEKYLFPSAMRSTAIILSPLGFNAESRETARGAMRDAGKLMLDVTSSVLAEMLRAKDEGNVANTRFEPMLDAFLLDLGR